MIVYYDPDSDRFATLSVKVMGDFTAMLKIDFDEEYYLVELPDYDNGPQEIVEKWNLQPIGEL